MGDVHSQICLAAEGLERIESEQGRRVDQVFSVGDLGLFLQEEDWNFLTGPKKYRKPEDSLRIRKVWDKWRWPLAAIAGNHEPFNRYRNWDPEYFGGKLHYTDSGELTHGIPGLRVAGLSGIHHASEMTFVSELEKSNRKLPRAESWAEMVRLAVENKISPKRLTYYKEFEVKALKTHTLSPHLLLLHDWPVNPPHIETSNLRRPEAEIVDVLRPEFVCCGHHHTPSSFKVGNTSIHALNIISRDACSRNSINPGWADLFEWCGEKFHFLENWPKYQTPNHYFNPAMV